MKLQYIYIACFSCFCANATQVNYPQENTSSAFKESKRRTFEGLYIGAGMSLHSSKNQLSSNDLFEKLEKIDYDKAKNDLDVKLNKTKTMQLIPVENSLDGIKNMDEFIEKLDELITQKAKESNLDLEKTDDQFSGRSNSYFANFLDSSRSSGAFELFCGYGLFPFKAASDVYVGAEVFLTFKNGKNYNINYDDKIFNSNLNFKEKSQVVPSVAVRTGLFSDSLKTLFYINGGIMFNEKYDVLSRYFGEDKCKTISHTSPFIGIGFEKKLSNKCSLRGEVAYKFRKTTTFRMNDEDGMTLTLQKDKHNYQVKAEEFYANTKAKTSTIMLKLLFSYYI